MSSEPSADLAARSREVAQGRRLDATPGRRSPDRGRIHDERGNAVPVHGSRALIDCGLVSPQTARPRGLCRASPLPHKGRDQAAVGFLASAKHHRHVAACSAPIRAPGKRKSGAIGCLLAALRRGRLSRLRTCDGGHGATRGVVLCLQHFNGAGRSGVFELVLSECPFASSQPPSCEWKNKYAINYVQIRDVLLERWNR